MFGGKGLINVFESSPLELVLITLAGMLRYQALRGKRQNNQVFYKLRWYHEHFRPLDSKAMSKDFFMEELC